MFKSLGLVNLGFAPLPYEVINMGADIVPDSEKTMGPLNCEPLLNVITSHG